MFELINLVLFGLNPGLDFCIELSGCFSSGIDGTTDADGDRAREFQVQNIVGLVRVGDSVKIQVLRNKKLINLTAIIVDNKAHTKSLTQNNPSVPLLKFSISYGNSFPVMFTNLISVPPSFALSNSKLVVFNLINI